jgi:GNAT superfamily N-acetyltransferase
MVSEPSANAPDALDRADAEVDPQVRPARVEDAAGAAAGIEALLVELGGEGPSTGELEEAVRELISHPEAGLLLVADCGGEIVGVLAASWQFAVHVPGRYATIQDLWVMPAWRSRAIGRDLIMALVTEAQERGVRRLEVGLPQSSFRELEATESFYRGNGFTPLGPRMRRLL